MKDLSTIGYNTTAEKLVEVLCKKTQSENRLFFHVMVAYYFAKMASMMRTNIDTPDRGMVPVNLYAMNLATSGEGKGHSTGIVEDQVINLFRERFLEETFPKIADKNLALLAIKRATKKGEDPDEELISVIKEFDQLGNLAFSFDGGTPAAVKQMRHKLLMANAGSMNMEIDEIGSNLLGNSDVLNPFLELYDVGSVKQKLIKNTSENVRGEEIVGRTPTNMMLLGTPSKLFDGAKVEEALLSLLDTGYARRCIFGYTNEPKKKQKLTPSEIYDIMTDTSSSQFLTDLSMKFGQLADMVNFGNAIHISKSVSLLLIEYRSDCEERAYNLPDHDEIRKAELCHRYFKTLKLAGAYAFIEGLSEITEACLYNAIKLVEVSGVSFKKMLTRERNYAKLAKYIATIGRQVTHVDLMEDLPFYKGGEAQKREMMTLAIAHGYKNNIVIKKIFNDGIEFLQGESLSETDLKEMVISYGTQLAEGYKNQLVPFDKLHQLTQKPNFHWVAHHLLDGYRREENCIAGVNMIVLDVDEGVSIATARLLLKDYKYLMYTTKSHTKAVNRFRIVMPMTHMLKMDTNDFKEFMANIYEWLPFEVDTATGQRSRKWMSNKGAHIYNDGQLLNSLLFIPKTTKNEDRKKFIADQQSMTNMERWFITNTGIGNRSNQLIKYALMLVDAGMVEIDIRARVLELNSKLQDRMKEAEVLTTIMITVSKAVSKRDS